MLMLQLVTVINDCFHMRIPKACLSVRTPRKEINPGFVNISPTLVIDTSMERSPRILKHWNPTSFFFSKKFEIDENEIFCRYPKKRNRPVFIDISPTLLIDTSIERCSRVLQHRNPKSWFFVQKSLKLKKLNFFLPYPEKRNRPGFVNISPELVIHTSMEWSSWVLHHGNPKIWFFKKKIEIEFWLLFWLVPKSWNRSSRFQHEPIWRHRGCIVVPWRVYI